MKKGEKMAKYQRYRKDIISIEKKEEYMQKYMPKIKYDRKADISGACIHFHTDTPEWKSPWDDNWFFISEDVRSHGKLFGVKTGKKRPVVKYDPVSRTVFFFDCDYYGWIKSCALALAGDVLEDNHNIFSIHGALLDIDGRGLTIIGPSRTGKTTLSYGLLRYQLVKLVADDWHFFKFFNSEVMGYGSEKSTYIRADIASTWKEYFGILKGIKLDNRGRAVVDIGYVIGKGGLKRDSTIRTVIILQRKKGESVLRKLKPKEALKKLETNDYFNPHLLQHNSWKKKVRARAFLKLLKNTDVYLLNTIESPEKTISRLCKLCKVKTEKMKKIKT